MNGDVPRPTESLLSDDAEVAGRVQAKDPCRQVRAGGPGTAALEHEQSAVVGETHAARHRQADEHHLHAVSVRHHDVGRVDPRTRGCRKLAQRLGHRHGHRKRHQ
jgi:hypothetical protein